jgi:hypothetical protein
MIKALMKVGIEGMHLNILKAIYEKPIANIILNGKKLKPFPLKSGTRQGCPLSLLLFNTVLKILARATRSEWLKGLNARPKNLILFTGKTLEDTVIDNYLPTRIPIAQKIRARIDKWDDIILKSFRITNEIITKVKRQPTD